MSDLLKLSTALPGDQDAPKLSLVEGVGRSDVGEVFVFGEGE